MLVQAFYIAIETQNFVTSRFRSKARKKEEEKAKEEPAGEDVLQIEPFEKTSKLRKTLRLRKKKSKKTAKFESDEESVR
jgi:hypothetical protein